MGNFEQFASRFSTQEEYQRAKRLRTAEGRRQFYHETDLARSSASRLGFKVRTYRSGEVTGAQFLTGRQTKVMPSMRNGNVVTSCFTRQARVKIRRSVECSDTFLGKFVTLSFAPDRLKPWELDELGNVRHDFAKYKLKKFLNTCSVRQKRLGRTLEYVWVAELQENGNIHFHILWNQFFPIHDVKDGERVKVRGLTSLWGQASNSVDVKRMSNPLHASRYMLKYMTKDNDSRIEGNRYNISSGLRETMEPIEKILLSLSGDQLQEQPWLREHVGEMRETLRALAGEIESRGGTVLDFGFSCPMGRSSKTYKDKKSGEMRRSRGVDPRLGKQVTSILTAKAEEIKKDIVPF